MDNRNANESHLIPLCLYSHNFQALALATSWWHTKNSIAECIGYTKTNHCCNMNQWILATYFHSSSFRVNEYSCNKTKMQSIKIAEMTTVLWGQFLTCANSWPICSTSKTQFCMCRTESLCNWSICSALPTSGLVSMWHSSSPHGSSWDNSYTKHIKCLDARKSIPQKERDMNTGRLEHIF